MEEGTQERRLRKKRERLDRMMEYLRQGLVCEMGCGSGFVLEYLSASLSGSVLIGLDRSPERLEAVASKGLRGVLGVAADITVRVLDANRFDSVVFVWSLHEVYSRSGDSGVASALKTAADLLKPDGVIIVHDFLRPEPAQTVLGFKNDATFARFKRFAEEFEQRRVTYDVAGQTVRLDIADAVEFVSKYDIADEDEWRDEMVETHFFYTLADCELRAAEAGLKLVSSERFPLEWAAVDTARRDMDFDLGPYFCWAQLVLEKAAQGYS
jgi:SAM-dependent methyltransferase